MGSRYVVVKDRRVSTDIWRHNGVWAALVGASPTEVGGADALGASFKETEDDITGVSTSVSRPFQDAIKALTRPSDACSASGLR